MYNIKQINTGVAEIIPVKVPEYELAMIYENELFLNKLSQEAHFRLILPPGNWTPLGMSDQLTEEQCKELVSKCTINGHSLFGYIKDRELHTKDTAKEAFASLMQANGCYSVNPNGKEEPKHQKGIKYLERLKWRWQQAEENTGTWIVLKRLS